MSTPRELRQLAFQALFQIDAAGGAESDGLSMWLDSCEEFKASERATAMTLARAAWEQREASDSEILALAPTWPASRQAAADRAILRLAYFEMTSGRVDPKVAINEAVELAKVFGTDKSPGFINALLDKVYRRMRGAGAGEGGGESGEGATAEGASADVIGVGGEGGTAGAAGVGGAGGGEPSGPDKGEG